jgi:hypothetical protein
VDVFVFDDPATSLLLLVSLSWAMAALHEYWHWLAARAAGVPALFGIDRRLCFLVFETDLSQLWSLPRNKRYAPQLAGLAVDGTRLGGLLLLRLLIHSGYIAAPPLIDKLAAAVAFSTVMMMAWQLMFFLRTDLYGVLVVWIGCYNLWEVKDLLLRQAFGHLTTEHAAQLAGAHPRDIVVGRWFRWVYLGGIPLALLYYMSFTVPILVAAGGWTASGLASDPTHARFWMTLGSATVVYLPVLTVAALWARSHLGRDKPPRRRELWANSPSGDE